MVSRAAALVFISYLACAYVCQAAPLTGESEDSPVNFSVQFAKHVRKFQSLADLQRAAKSKGDVRGSGGPGTTIHWRYVDDTKSSYMTAEVSDKGFIGVSILTDKNVEIVFNSRGEWDCEPELACAPLSNTIK